MSENQTSGIKICVFGFYFPPDLCAGSFRLQAIVDEFASRKDVIQITVLTTRPNRYNDFNPTNTRSEINSVIKVVRLWVPHHNSGMFGQALAFLVYALQAFFYALWLRPRYIFCTSARLLTASLGVLVSLFTKASVYIDIRDIFTDVLKSKFKQPSYRMLIPLFERLEFWTYVRAKQISIVSPGYSEHLLALGFSNFRVFPNGVDDIFLNHVWTHDKIPSINKVIIYAGNVGFGQNLHKIIPDLANRLGKNYVFKVIGNGGMIQELKFQVAEKSASNVEFYSSVNRNELLEFYESADFLFLHLNSATAFEKCLPSKVYEYLAVGKPVLAGVRGVAASFLLANSDNCLIFPPEDCAEAERVIRNYVPVEFKTSSFSRDNSRGKYARELVIDVATCFGMKG